MQFQALYAPYFQHAYEPDVAMLVDALLTERSTFFDVGSNWGYFSLYAASNREHLTIHAFEPMASTYRDLVNCVEQAGIQAMVTCHSVALSNADGESSIIVPDNLHSGQAMLSHKPGALKIATRRLDSLNLPGPDLIKVDVEGHELEVLLGARRVLESHWPFIVFENKPLGEVLEKTLEPLWFLTSLGYRLYVPVLLRRTADVAYMLLPGGQRINPQDQWVLEPLEPNSRLLWPADLNVFACHESRMAQLAAIFNG